jgi:VanZ family protein
MSHRPSDQFAGSLLSRHGLALLAGVYTLLVLQISLIPFDFSSSFSWGSVPDRADVRWIDLLTNIALYAPLGLLATTALLRYGWRVTASMIVVAAFGTIVSAAVESTQAFSAVRIASTLDILANALGTLGGAWIGAVYGYLIPRLIGAALEEFRTRPSAAMLRAYVILLLFVALMPLAFAMDGARLWATLQQGHLAPFDSYTFWAERMDAAEAAADAYGAAYADMMRMRFFARWAAEAASFLVLAWLLLPVLRYTYRFTRMGAATLAFWMGAALGVAVSILQAPMVSRGFDSTDIVMRLIGLTVGVVSWFFWNLHPRSRQRERWRQRAIPAAAVCAAVVYLLYTGLIPFRWDASGNFVDAVTGDDFRLLYAYCYSRFDVMVDDMSGKLLPYIVIGIGCGCVWRQNDRQAVRRRLLRIALFGCALAVIIELVQVYLLVRITSLTDPAIAITGCCIGVGAESLVRRLVQSSRVEAQQAAASSAISRPRGAVPARSS